MASNFGTNVQPQVIAHFVETMKIAIVRQCELRSRKPERMDILLVDRCLGVQSDTTNMTEKAIRPDLAGETLEVAVEYGQIRRRVPVGRVGLDR